MQKKILVCIFLVLLACSKTEKLLICDFNSTQRMNALGGEFGSWNKDPNDTTQFCEEAIVNGRGGNVLQLSYDVDSQNPAYNGLWMKLQGADLSNYKKLTLWIKGDELNGYPDCIKIELKNQKGEKGSYTLSGITSEWQKVEIPLKDFSPSLDLSKITELVFVFSDILCQPKMGTIYIDDICAE